MEKKNLGKQWPNYEKLYKVYLVFRCIFGVQMAEPT